MKKLLFAMIIGAALAWAFDPDSGSRRREALRRKLDETGLTKASPPVSSSATRSSAFGDSTNGATSAMTDPASIATIP